MGVHLVNLLLHGFCIKGMMLFPFLVSIFAIFCFLNEYVSNCNNIFASISSEALLFEFSAGTTKTKNLDENIGSLNVKLSRADLQEIADSLPPDEIAGSRSPDIVRNLTWRSSDTPQKS